MPSATWVDRGWQLYGGEENVLPTFVGARTRTGPPAIPASIESCDAETLERWEKDAWRFPPYHYRREAGLVSKKGHHWRYASVRERELLMGFREGHTACCWNTGDAKANPRQYENQRLSLLGESFHCGTMAYLLGHALYQHGLLAQPPSSDIVMCQLALASSVATPGSHKKHQRPKRVAEGERWRPPTAEEQMVVELLRRQTHVGNDIRSTGIFGTPSRWPRNEINAS